MEVYVIEKVRGFIKGLDNSSRARCYTYFDMLEIAGNELRYPYSKMILSGVFELRVGGVRNIRIVYSFKDNVAVVYHAFAKKSNKIEQKEIEIIKSRYKSLQYDLYDI